mmetsp:Transcript_25026/g.28748  ORF Transcript_25026/g.28748 Transcript_25026/m.28748 type:complete len:121 (-) Transcript_25026:19-381(-)
MRLTGVASSESPNVPLISYPAILPMYVFVPHGEISANVPEEFQMPIFLRYLKYESAIIHDSLVFESGKLVEVKPELFEHIMYLQKESKIKQEHVMFIIKYLRRILKIETGSFFSFFYLGN